MIGVKTHGNLLLIISNKHGFDGSGAGVADITLGAITADKRLQEGFGIRRSGENTAQQGTP